MLPYANRIKQQLKHLTGVTKNLKKMKEKLEQKKLNSVQIKIKSQKVENNNNYNKWRIRHVQVLNLDCIHIHKTL